MGPDGGAGAKPIVRTLLTTAIKGFALDTPKNVRLGGNGAVGDRDFYVVDVAGRLLSIGRTGAFASWRAAFDEEAGVLTLTSSQGSILSDKVIEGQPVVVDLWGRDSAGRVVGGQWSTWLSDIAGEPVDLVRADDPGGGLDEAPVTLLSEESVADVTRHASIAGIDMRRFRMLLNISGVEAYEEESWRARDVRVGSALLHVHGPVPRCLAITRNPDSGSSDLHTLHFIAKARGRQPNDFGRGLNMGVYAVVVEPGVVTVGDTLDLEP